jgi:hypothetical protein
LSSTEIASQLAALERQRRTVTRVVTWTTSAVTLMSVLAFALVA